jgi:peptide/nickel transport system ATP-binding protein
MEPQLHPAAPLLSVDGLSVEFATEHGWVRVIDGVSFTVSEGETLGLVGESGSGKSVTSLAVLGLIPNPPGRLVGGTVQFLGQELLSLPERRFAEIRGAEIAMIFQEPMTSMNPAFTVGEQIAETFRRHRGGSRAAARRRAVEMLGLVGIPRPKQAMRSYPHQMSGGMRQRAMIAMAVCCEPKLLIADEPTTALDVTVQAQVLELLCEMQRTFAMSMLFITHDLGVVAEVCDSVAVMYAGQVVERGSLDEVFTSPAHPYAEGLLQARPEIEGGGAPLMAIPGGPPVPWELPSGCRFNPRCQYALDICRHADVPLSGTGHLARCVRLGELTLKGAR